MSLNELASTLEKEGKLYLGCKGKIYDVSEGESFYGKGAGYHLFIGNDSSVALAKMDFNPEYMDPSQMHWQRDLNEEELNVLEEWVELYERKYTHVAYIKDDGKLKI